MRDLYFTQSNDEVPLSDNYRIKKQRFKVLSVFNVYNGNWQRFNKQM